MSALRPLKIGATLCFLFILCTDTVIGAPYQPEHGLEPYYTDSTAGCYYNFQHYDEGDRIITNEPCLNCTCHNRMLMCYLRVCPFTKAIGEECTVEKRPDQCCPVITCPEVPVQLLSATTTAAPDESTEVGHADTYGCSIDEVFYADGVQVPSNPYKPCELCYCIRNKTACVMQECTLHVEGCKPIYQEGKCCPIKYDCDYEEDHIETTMKPTPGLIFTTTMMPGVSSECYHDSKVYADGASIETESPCEHCYCMKGEIVCAVQECGTPLEKAGKNCRPIPPEKEQCCPTTYECDSDVTTELMTTELLETTPKIVDGKQAEVTTTTVEEFTPESETIETIKQVTESPILTTMKEEELPVTKPHVLEDEFTSPEKETQYTTEEPQRKMVVSEITTAQPEIDEVQKPVETTEHVEKPEEIVTTKYQPTEEELSTEREVTTEPKIPEEEHEKTTELEHTPALEETEMPLMGTKKHEETTTYKHVPTEEEVTETEEIVKTTTDHHVETEHTTQAKEEISTKQISVEDEKLPTTDEQELTTTSYISTDEMQILEHVTTESQTTIKETTDLYKPTKAEKMADEEPTEGIKEIVKTELPEIQESTEEIATEKATEYEPKITEKPSYPEEQQTISEEHVSVTEIDITEKPSYPEEQQTISEEHIPITEIDITEKPSYPDEQQTISEEHVPVTEIDITEKPEAHITEHDKSYREEETTMYGEEHRDETVAPTITETPPSQENEIEEEDLTQQFDPHKQKTDKPFMEETSKLPSEHTTLESKKEFTEPSATSHETESYTESIQITEQPHIPSEDISSTKPSLISTEGEPTEKQEEIVTPLVDTTFKADIEPEKITTISTVTTQAPITETESVQPSDKLATEAEVQTTERQQSVTGISISEFTKEMEKEPEYEVITTEVMSSEISSEEQSTSHREISDVTEVSTEEEEDVIRISTQKSISSTDKETSLSQETTTTSLESESPTETSVVHMMTDEVQTKKIEIGDHVMEPTTIKTDVGTTKEDLQTTITDKHISSTETLEQTTEQQISLSSSESQKPEISEATEEITTDRQITKVLPASTSPAAISELETEEPTHVTMEHKVFETTESVSTQTVQEVEISTEGPVEIVTPISTSEQTEKQETPVEIVTPTLTLEHTEAERKSTGFEEELHDVITEKPTEAYDHIEGSGQDDSQYSTKTIPEVIHDTQLPEVISTTPEKELVTQEKEFTTKQYDTTEMKYTKETEKPVESVDIDKETEKPLYEETTISQEPEEDVTEKQRITTIAELEEASEPYHSTEKLSTEEQETVKPETEIVPTEEEKQLTTESSSQITEKPQVAAHVPTLTEEKHETEEETVPSVTEPSDVKSTYETETESATKLVDHEQTTLAATDEIPLPVIPGEGNCLVEGQTYENNSAVPSMNPCQSSCRCVSSIVQCESVTCPPPPDNMENCMPIYSSPHSCCPIYSCLGLKSTLPAVDTETPEIVETTTALHEVQETSAISLESSESTETPKESEELPTEETVKVGTEPETELATTEADLSDRFKEAVTTKESDEVTTEYEKEITTVPLFDVTTSKTSEIEQDVTTSEGPKYVPEITTVYVSSPQESETSTTVESEPKVSTLESETKPLDEENLEQTTKHEELESSPPVEEHTVAFETTKVVTEDVSSMKVTEEEQKLTEETQKEMDTTPIVDVQQEIGTTRKQIETETEKETETTLVEQEITTPAEEASAPEDTSKTMVYQTTEEIAEDIHTIAMEDHVKETTTYKSVEPSISEESKTSLTPEQLDHEVTTIPTVISSETPKLSEEEVTELKLTEPTEEIEPEKTEISTETPVKVVEVTPKIHEVSTEEIEETQKPESEVTTLPYDENKTTEVSKETSSISESTDKSEEPEYTTQHVSSIAHTTEEEKEEVTTVSQIIEEVTKSDSEESKQEATRKQGIETTVSLDEITESSTEIKQSEEITTLSDQKEIQEVESPHVTTITPESSSFEHMEETQEPEKITTVPHIETTVEVEQRLPEEVTTQKVDVPSETTEEDKEVQSPVTEISKTSVTSEEEQTTKYIPEEEQKVTTVEIVSSTESEEPIVTTSEITSETESIQKQDYTTEKVSEVEPTEVPSHEIEETEKQTTVKSETEGPVTTDIIKHDIENEVVESSSEHSTATTEEKAPEMEVSSHTADHTTTQPQEERRTTLQIKDVEQQVVTETGEPSEEPEQLTTAKPLVIQEQITEIISTKSDEAVTQTTSKIPEETPSVQEVTTTYPKVAETTKPKEVSTTLSYTGTTSSTPQPHISEAHVPEMPDYNLPSDDYDEDQNSFGPGTCRYGGKIYVSAQQIPRDDPCDFCFCFRSDIICLQQSCPPPIPGCHEEPIPGFCCPRYECPVSMAVALNLTTTSTTTTTTLPPHFLAHAYQGAAYQQGCQIQGQAYQVGEVVKSASGPCLHCTCGGDGQMKCDPKNCSPQPMLQQMIAAVVSRRR